MLKANTRASYIDVTLHQAARREALAAQEEEPPEMSLKAFLFIECALLCLLFAVLVYVTP